MPDPFLVLATQNPIENEGVYPLPEAQRDRFLFKIIVDYPGLEEEREIVYRMGAEPPVAQQVMGPDELVRLQGVASRVFVHHALVDYVVRLVVATRTPAEHGWSDVARLGRPTARHPRATLGIVARRPGAGAGPRPRLRAAPGRRSTSRRTCCGTGWCCPTTRWPTACPVDHIVSGSWRRCRCRRCTAATAGGPAPAARLHPRPAVDCRPIRPRRVRPHAGQPARRRADRPTRRPAPSRQPRRRRGRRRAAARSRASRACCCIRPRPSSGHRRAGAGDGAPPRCATAGRRAAASLELTVRGRLDGLLQGNHLGLVPGPGSEPGEARTYQPGDDVRRMDWAVTARTTVPHVRADGGRPGAGDLGGDGPVGQPGLRHGGVREARPGRRRARGRHAPDRGGRQPDRRASSARASSGRRDPGPRRLAARARAAALGRRDAARRRRHAAAISPRRVEALRRPPRRRGLAVVVSDFLGEPEWERALRGAVGAARAARVEVARPARAGAARGRHCRARRPGDRAPARGADHAAAVPGVRRGRRRRTATGWRWRCAGAGAAHLRLRTDSDWVADVVRFVARRASAPGQWRGLPMTVSSPRPGGCCCCSSSSRWPSATSLLLRRRRRDTLAFTNLELLDRVAPKRPGRLPAPPGPRADPRAGPAHGRVGGPDGRGAGAAQPGDRRAGDRRVAVDAGHGRRAQPAWPRRRRRRSRSPTS